MDKMEDADNRLVLGGIQFSGQSERSRAHGKLKSGECTKSQTLNLSVSLLIDKVRSHHPSLYPWLAS